MTIQAHAKVNLVLRLVGKRTDGYHDIETLMVPVTLADELDVEVSAGTGITLACDEDDIPSNPSNLAWRAVEAFARHTSLVFHTRITLRKMIPHGAGLGGGSSDAAAVLKALDALHGTRLGARALETIAADIGSDVPFFIRSRPSWCRGRGERIEGAGAFCPLRILLLKPPFPVSTAWAYSAYSAKPQNLQARQQSVHGMELSNDLEGPVFRKFLLLPAIKNWLLRQLEVEAAMMSGSGSTLFAIVSGSTVGLEQRAREMFGKSLWTCACETLSAE